MFNRDSDLIPRTYALKGFRKRRMINLKQVLIGLFALLAAGTVILVIYLSMNGFV